MTSQLEEWYNPQNYLLIKHVSTSADWLEFQSSKMDFLTLRNGFLGQRVNESEKSGKADKVKDDV